MNKSFGEIEKIRNLISVVEGRISDLKRNVEIESSVPMQRLYRNSIETNICVLKALQDALWKYVQ